MSSSSTTLPQQPLPAPPTPNGLPLIGNALPFLTSKTGLPLEYVRQQVRQHGDFVRLRVIGRSLYVVASPDLAHEVLVKRGAEFQKAEAIAPRPVGLSRFLGKGILTASHEDWRPQRKMIQPLMHTQHITQYAEMMTRFGHQLMAEWVDGAERDIHADMTQVTMWVIADAMFGLNVNQTSELEHAGAQAQAITVSDLASPLPAWLQGGRDRAAEKINSTLTELVERFTEEHQKRNGETRHDLLSLLLDARDEDGQSLDKDFIRNNILTLFFAGHETTANTLTWVFYYLSQYPDVLHQLQHEVDTVLAGRTPTLADLPNLPYTLTVIKETMRIRPTVAIIPRFIPKGTALGGYQTADDGLMVISIDILHHDERTWPNPYRFDPTRFSAENEPNIPKYAYMPFGAGPRICIGNSFALMEAHLLLAQFASHYTLTLSDTKVEPLVQVTTSPKNGLRMRVSKR